MALLMARRLAAMEGWTLLSAGTDGQDGPTDAAGAFADGATIQRAESVELNAEEFERRCDSLTFFDKEGGSYRTGLTGTNVMDLHILICTPRTSRSSARNELS
mmetsp:Transcript_20421/g.31922  ORF Transcript_20421/g.31922 Transcript_20421/m.31922 type:complete len:103 (-) Transcript_20421:25-333(-)